MIKLVVFDMDGTIADTSMGILNSHRHAHKMMGSPVPQIDVLRSVIGGPLLNSYITRFGFSPEDARTAVQYYRAYYAENGFAEAEVYEGFKETLQELKNKGCLIGVATLKAEKFVKPMLEVLGLTQYFDIIYGMDDKDTRTKTGLIDMCVKDAGVKKEETLMVGDSEHDMMGAQQSGVNFIGVTYGFGFKGELSDYGCKFCDKPLELLEYI